MLPANWTLSVCVPGDQDYETLLALRFSAYRDRGKTPPGATLEMMRDDYDRRCQVFVIKDAKGNLVGSVRGCKNPEAGYFEFARFQGAETVLPSLHECTSFSRLFVNPTFQGRGVFYLLQSVMEEATRAWKRRYVVGSGDGSLLEKYLSLGWRRAGLSTRYVELNGVLDELMVFDVQTPSRSKASRVTMPPSSGLSAAEGRVRT